MATSPIPSCPLITPLPVLSPADAGNDSSDGTIGLPPRTASITQKEWIVPPRPKPGRKPATDVPPTKRKAQNRAAQRAFRERRAAKVEELEEQMKQTEESVAKERNEMGSRITRLEADVERFKGEVVAWQSRYQTLEQQLECERREKEDAEKEMARLRDEASAYGVLDKPLRSANMELHGSSLDSLDHIGCGNCTKDTRCECLEQASNISMANFADKSLDATAKRPHSPERSNTFSKRQHLAQSECQPSPESLETDFTGQYASAAASSLSLTSPSRAERPGSPGTVISIGTTVDDPCGFCQDGTPCVCAQLEQSATKDMPQLYHELASMMPQFTPPPSESDIPLSTRAITTRRAILSDRDYATSSKSPCNGVPGTCAQCRADPNSTLFCKSLSAVRSRSTSQPSEQCCKTSVSVRTDCACKPPAAAAAAATPASASDPLKPNAVYLSCADTYTTLSRHPRYSEATDHLETWLGKLKTSIPRGEESRPAMEIEAASVMSVLRFFDCNFGRG